MGRVRHKPLPKSCETGTRAATGVGRTDTASGVSRKINNSKDTVRREPIALERSTAGPNNEFQFSPRRGECLWMAACAVLRRPLQQQLSIHSAREVISADAY